MKKMNKGKKEITQASIKDKRVVNETRKSVPALI